jgi:hypothetical protein
MATDLDRAKSTSGGKYDAFIASRLAKAEGRIRLLDLTAALLGFAALTLAYIVVVVLCDSKLELSQHARKLSLYAFLAGGAVYLFLTVVRPLRRRVNPYYAARQVERQLPGAKNSIVNWVDLHGQPLPPAIRGALGQRAAKDLSRVDLDRAISGRRAAWMGALAGLFAVAFLASFFLLGPSPFGSLLKRAFNPFHQVGVSTRTQLVLVKPEGGDATVTVGRGVGFVVEVSGKVPDPKAPDAVKLLYRYEEGDPWLERRLAPETGREWTASLSAIEIKNGLWYKVTGGDAATEEHRIRVRAAPAVTDFLAAYHYRPYVARADEVRHERELKALRGTEVSLRIRTNRTIRAGRLEFEGKDKSGTKTVQGQPAGDDPRTLLVRFVLDEDSKYRFHFNSTDGEAYSDLNAYSVTAIPDEKPSVELTKPGQDIRLPVNGLLQLEGKAGDDIGVQSVLLRMRVVGGDRLQDRPYRSGDKLRLADGGYPREVEYKDFVELPRVKGEDDRAFPLRPGMELEYWLEARDACDYPRPNPPGESKHFRVRLTEPENNESKRQQEKQQAEQDKKRHEDQQDQKLQQENQERRQERQEQEARNKEEQDKSNQAGAGAGENKDEMKEGDKPDNSEGQKNKEAGDSKGGQGENNNELSKEDQKVEEQIGKALEERERNKNNPGEAKPDKSEQGQGEGTPSDKPDGGNRADDGKPSGDPSKNDGDDKGRQAEREGAKGPKDNSGDSTKSEAKKAGENKDDSKAEKKQGDSGKPSDQGEAKPSASDGKDDKSANGEGKADAGAPSRNATAKDIEELAKRLESNDPRQREEAKRQLEQIAKQAQDPQAREKAKETLEQTGEPDGSAGAKPMQSGDGSKNTAGDGSPEGGDKKQGDDASKNPEQKGNQGDKDKQSPSPNKNNTGETISGSEGGDTPGGGRRREGADRKRENGDAQQPPNKSSKPRGHRATQMQLEEFAKKVDKKILKDAGVSEEAWKKYLEARRKQVAPPEKHRPETPADPRQASQLPSMGGQTIQPSPSGQAGDVHGPDRGQPPPAYRDSFREFTRKMSKNK